MSIIEVMITGMILFIAFLHFFPQYTIKSKWDKTLLIVKVRDTINTIDRLDKIYDFGTSSVEFNNFMNRTFQPEKAGGVFVWWKGTKDLQGYTEDMPVPYFTEGYKESMVDVEFMSDEYTAGANTVALWHLNDGTGTAATDSSGNGNTGNLVNGPKWTVGKLKSALRFDGVDDYVSAPSSSLSSTSFTIEAWAKFANTAGEQVIAGKYNNGFLWWDGNNMRVEFKGATTGSWRGIPQDGGAQWKPLPNIWYHFAATFGGSGTTVRLYVNGQLVSETNPMIPINENPLLIAENFAIGRWELGVGSSRYFNGIIDEVRVSNIARTNFDIRYNPYTFTLGMGYPY